MSATQERVVALAAVVALVAFAGAPLFGAGQGIAFLTEGTYPEAIACGRSGADCAVTPYQLCPADIPQFSAWVATPFSRVASSVFERVNRRQRPRPVEFGLANLLGLGIYVSPKENSDKADSIERVVLRRAGRTIEPTTTTLAPITVGTEVQAMKHLSRGYFAFPMEALSPDADVTIVFHGSSGDVTCTIGRDKLQTLR